MTSASRPLDWYLWTQYPINEKGGVGPTLYRGPVDVATWCRASVGEKLAVLFEGVDFEMGEAFDVDEFEDFTECSFREKPIDR